MMSVLKVVESKSIATVTLSRPDVRNAFNPEMIIALSETFKKLSLRQDLRGVVLRGEGKSFCAGGDVNWMKDSVQYTTEQNKEDAFVLFDMFQAIYDCHVPIIGLVHGSAFGGALGLIACCDYVIAEERTLFCFSEVKLGIAPAVISAFVRQKCPTGPVTPLMLLGQSFTAAKAQSVGLVHEIADEESLQDRLEVAMGWLQEIGPQASRATKSLLHQLPHLSWTETRDEVAEVISELRTSSEGQEGLRSFIEKRKASWKGQ